MQFDSCGGIDVLDVSGPQGIQVFLNSDGELAREAFVLFRQFERRIIHGARSGKQNTLQFAIDGSIKLEITKYPLAEASVAHSLLEERKCTGKLVLIP